jgi:hypothetical protein
MKVGLILSHCHNNEGMINIGKNNMENSNKESLRGAYLPPEEVAHFDHALKKLEKATLTLQMVANGMKPAEAWGTEKQSSPYKK